MQKALTAIKVVSLTSREHEALLVRLLKKLDHDVAIINSHNWLQGQVTDPNSVFILVLPATYVSTEKITNAITATPKSRCLVIFFPPITNELSLVLNVCDDCCSWTADEVELAFRLNRIISAHQGFSHTNWTRVENKVWGDLNLIGKSKLFRNVLSIIEKAANCDVPVLIEGETGCGKERVAKAIHHLSNRKGYPFIPINCGAVPDHLIENEFFGHDKGAYTDAKQNYMGSIEQANRGTLFLDEIEALSAKGQVALLRFIEDKIIKPLGSHKSRKVDVRIIVASNASLSKLVDQNIFRRDLLYRLNILYLYLPPLRHRENDVHHLAEFFMEKYRREYGQPNKQLHPKTIAWMSSYPWPGNVRELENFIHRSFLLTEDLFGWTKDETISEIHADYHREPFHIKLNFEFDASFNEAKNNVINHFEKQYLTWLISKSDGNVSQAADKAQKERRALGKLLKKHGINPSQYRKY